MDIKDAKVRVQEPIDQTSNLKGKLRSSIYTEDYRGEYYNIAINKLLPFKNQARKIFDQKSLESMALTIREHGIRQPLTVIPSEAKEGHYEIISGERRYRAAILAELKTVPCIILRDRKKAEEIAIIENIQREDLHPIELMRAYANLLREGICSSRQEIADKLSVSKSSVIETLNLNNLSEQIQALLLEHRISNRDFLRLLCKQSEQQQQQAIEHYLKTNQIKKRHHLQKTRVMSLVLCDGELILDKHKFSQLSERQRLSAEAIFAEFFLENDPGRDRDR